MSPGPPLRSPERPAQPRDAAAFEAPGAGVGRVRSGVERPLGWCAAACACRSCRLVGTGCWWGNADVGVDCTPTASPGTPPPGPGGWCHAVSVSQGRAPRHRPSGAELRFGCGSVWLGFLGGILEKEGLSSLPPVGSGTPDPPAQGWPCVCGRPGPSSLSTCRLWGSRGLRPVPQSRPHIPGGRGAGPECVPLVSSRVGQRGSGLSMSAARSEHEVSEIIDGLSEQEVSPQFSPESRACRCRVGWRGRHLSPGLGLSSGAVGQDAGPWCSGAEARGSAPCPLTPPAPLAPPLPSSSASHWPS